MGDEIEKLKSVLRSLVVSSPTQVTVFSLTRDYKNMIGAALPVKKFGYRDPVEFLKERFSDCFLFCGQPSNPVLTLIVPNTLKHIDKFVQKQKSSSGRCVPKRRSIPESVVKPLNENLAFKSYIHNRTPLPTVKEPAKFIVKETNSPNNGPKESNIVHSKHTGPSKPNGVSDQHSIGVNKHDTGPRKNSNQPNIDLGKHNTGPSKPSNQYTNDSRKPDITSGKSNNDFSEPNLASYKSTIASSKSNLVPSKSYISSCEPNGTINLSYNNKNMEDKIYKDSETEYILSDSSTAVKNFLKKRLPLYNSLHYLDEDQHADSWGKTAQDDDSGRHTSSSSNSAKAQQLEQLKSDVLELIADAPEGLWCTDVIRLYRERYNRELNFVRFGFTSILSLVYCLEKEVQITRPVDTGDWLLQERARASAAPPTLRSRRLRSSHVVANTSKHADPEEALPGVDYDPDVFPKDCMDFMESIESMPLTEFRPGAMVEVMIGEVYSPSHFWYIRLGDNYNIAMEDMMDDMKRYYNNEGRDRMLACGAVRVGHYCSTLYDNDWHRSLIVKIVDSDTVKVRHVDYGTVDTVSVTQLKPLRREWSRLPAQAARARLAGVRPPAAGWRWPRAAAAAFLALVTNRRLVANVVALDHRDMVAEVLLIDTSSEEDVCIGTELIRAGHADTRPDSALRVSVGNDDSEQPASDVSESASEVVGRAPRRLRTWDADGRPAPSRLFRVAALSERLAAKERPSTPSVLQTLDMYLYPRFEALENGDTPNYAEIHAYLRDGIALDYVEDYRAHVPTVLPKPISPEPSASPASSPASPAPSARASPAPSARASPAPMASTSQTSTQSECADSSSSPPMSEHAHVAEDAVAACEVPTRIPLFLPDSSSPTMPAPSSPQNETRPATAAQSPAQALAARWLPTPQSNLSPYASIYEPRPSCQAPSVSGQACRPSTPNEFARSPPPPYGAPTQQLSLPGVTLSLAECETYRALSHVNAAAAHWFIVGAMGRAADISVPQRPAHPSMYLTRPPMHPPHPSMHPLHPPMHPPHPQMFPPRPQMHSPYHQMHPPLRIRPPPGFGP